MTFDLKKHPFFTPWKDRETGVESYILNQHVAPVQQSFYFTNSSLSPDEKWLWFYTAFPPSPQKSLGVVNLDPDHPEIHLFPQASFSSASPLVAPEGDAVYLCSGPSVWKLHLDGSMQTVVSLDEEYINHRHLYRLATHLTLSADGKTFLLDGEIGNHWFAGLGNIATGTVQILKEFSHNRNHGQFSPVDPHLFTLAEDWFFDKITGRRFHYDHRIWLMNTSDTVYECLDPEIYCKGADADCHEWWSRDGKMCFVHYATGAYELDLLSRQRIHVWKQPLCHAHTSSDRSLWCADQTPYQWEESGCQVRFFDRVTGNQVNIISRQPYPPYHRSAYHIDPHPQFSPKDTWVAWTTTVQGRVDVALTPVEPLVKRLRGG